MKRMEYIHTPDEIRSAATDYIIKTTEEYNALYEAIKKDGGWFDRVYDLCKYYYEGHPCGGVLHIVLDDGNLDDSSINFSHGLAYGWSDHQALDISNLMKAMSIKQRKRLYNAL